MLIIVFIDTGLVCLSGAVVACWYPVTVTVTVWSKIFFAQSKAKTEVWRRRLRYLRTMAAPCSGLSKCCFKLVRPHGTETGPYQLASTSLYESRLEDVAKINTP
jgi:hypothetical protein